MKASRVSSLGLSHHRTSQRPLKNAGSSASSKPLLNPLNAEQKRLLAHVVVGLHADHAESGIQQLLGEDPRPRPHISDKRARHQLDFIHKERKQLLRIARPRRRAHGPLPANLPMLSIATSKMLTAQRQKVHH